MKKIDESQIVKDLLTKRCNRKETLLKIIEELNKSKKSYRLPKDWGFDGEGNLRAITFRDDLEAMLLAIINELTLKLCYLITELRKIQQREEHEE